MASQQEGRIALVSYVSKELHERIQKDARHSNRSVAGMVRELLSRACEAPARPENR